MGIKRIGDGVWCVSGEIIGPTFVLRLESQGEMRRCDGTNGGYRGPTPPHPPRTRFLLYDAKGANVHRMTDKQAVIDAIRRLPEDASLDDIAEELQILAAVRRGRADVSAGRAKTQDEAGRLLESWASAWTSE
jgi:predicted transcriptional regulator